MEEKQDLGWQKPAETDNLQKSEAPDAGYMKDHELCQKCHGKRHDGDCK